MSSLRFPIWAKIGAAFSLTFLIALAVGIVVIGQLAAIEQRTVSTRDDWLPSARTLAQLRASVRQYRITEASLALASHDREAASALEALREAAAAVDKARADCEPFTTAASEDEDYMRAFDKAWPAYRTASERLVRDMSAAGADRGQLAADEALYEAAAGAVTNNIVFNLHAGAASANGTVQFVAFARQLISWALLAGLAVNAILAIALTRAVSVPLRVMTAAMKRLAERDFAVAIPARERKDELGTMANSIEIFRNSLVETERLRAQEDAQHARLLESEQRFRAVFDSVNDGIFITDPGTLQFIEVNQRACEMFGFQRSELIGQPLSILSGEELPYTREEAMRRTTKALYEGPQTFDWRCKTKDQRLFWAEISIRFARFGERNVVLATLRDITERRRTQAHIQQMARHDTLTGLPNRAVFMESVGREGARASREGGQFAVVYLDLDHFKDVNDTLGHPAGDELLRAVANRLRFAVRQSDIVARFGGDEFAVLAADIHGSVDAAALGDKVLKAFEAPFPIQGNQIRSGCSMGIAVSDREGTDPEALMSHADVALYRAKSEGRGTYRFFTDAMDRETRAHVTLIAELREAIESQEMFLMYQPQVEISSGRITGLEALLRWRHPRRGILGPETFIHEAEKSGLIVTLGERVLHEACRQAKAWHDSGHLPRTIAVNLSVAQLKVPLEFERLVMRTLAEIGLPPDRLEIELTESILMGTGEHRNVLVRLRGHGIRLAIDDFGTGYSCLDYLRRCPADRIKIAQSFVAHLEEAGDATVCKATIGLARELGMKVIAEGVETRKQSELLSAWGCNEAQGFFYAPPLLKQDLEPLLRARIIEPPRASGAYAAA